MRLRLAAALGLLTLPLLITQGCRRTPQSTEPASPAATVVAEDRLGEITLAALDRYLLALPADQRWPASTEPAEWYATITRRLAVERLLYDEAVETGTEDDREFQSALRRILRNVYSSHYLAERVLKEKPITEEELRAFYDEHLERYSREEQREVYHLFRRLAPGGSKDALREEMERLRARILAGESFETVARESSDSETRHEGGRLGLVARGRFTADFDKVVFALEPGQPSATLLSADGAHLFFVTSVLEARDYTFDEARRTIYQELEAARRQRILEEAAAELPAPENTFVAERAHVQAILASGEGSAILLEVGDYRLTAGELALELQTLRRQLGAHVEPELPFRMLDEIRYREIIYQALQKEGLPEIPQEGIDKERRRQLIDHFTRRKMIAYLDHHPEPIDEYYQNNTLRFASPLKVHLRRLTVPLGDDASAVMARLEEARPELDAGRLRLEELASSLGGKTNDLGLLSLPQLQTLDPKAVRFVSLLKPGEHSPPYQLGSALVLFRVDSRQEAVPRPLALVRSRVVDDYLTHYAAQVYRDLSAELLAESGFKLYPERLANVGPIVPSG